MIPALLVGEKKFLRIPTLTELLQVYDEAYSDDRPGRE
jgi:hypothetical protein